VVGVEKALAMFKASHYRSALIEALPCTLLFASVSGAHLCEFPSPDSDVDHACRAAGQGDARPESAQGVSAPVADGVEIDLVGHDLVKYVVMLLEQHGNYWAIFAPLVVVDTPWAEELRDLAGQGRSPAAYHAYVAMPGASGGNGANRQFGVTPLKPLLCAYRVSLTGIHLRTGRVNANLADWLGSASAICWR
jgi:hypothetical protein